MKRRSSLGIGLLFYIALSVSYGEAQKGGRCTISDSLPDGFTRILDLNNPPERVYSGEFGRGVRIRQVSGVTGVSYILVVTSGTVPTVHVFLLKQDGSLAAAPSEVPTNPLLLVPTNNATRYMPEIGDVNGDEILDIAIASLGGDPAYVFLGEVSASGVLSYMTPPLQLTAPEPASRFGTSMALGDLDEDGREEVVIGAPGYGSGKTTVVGKVFIYRFNTLTSSFDSGRKLNTAGISPGLKTDDEFGRSVAIGHVTGGGAADLIVGASRREVGSPSVTDAGAVFVFSGFVFSTPPTVTSTLTSSLIAESPISLIKDDHIGFAVAAGKLNGIVNEDLIATTAWSTATTRAVWAPGPISPTTLKFVKDLQPYPGSLSKGWATSGVTIANINGGLDDVLIGAPNASDCTNSVGAVHIYLSGNSSNPTILQPPTLDPDWGAFGWSVSAVATALQPTDPNYYEGLVVVGEPGRNLNSVGGAGQVYVYKYKTPPPQP